MAYEAGIATEADFDKSTAKHLFGEIQIVAFSVVMDAIWMTNTGAMEPRS